MNGHHLYGIFCKTYENYKLKSLDIVFLGPNNSFIILMIDVLIFDNYYIFLLNN